MRHLPRLTFPAPLAPPPCAQGHNAPVSALAFDDEGGVLGSGSCDGTVLLWSKDAAGAGNREGWSQIAKLELALQVRGRVGGVGWAQVRGQMRGQVRGQG